MATESSSVDETTKRFLEEFFEVILNPFAAENAIIDDEKSEFMDKSIRRELLSFQDIFLNSKLEKAYCKNLLNHKVNDNHLTDLGVPYLTTCRIDAFLREESVSWSTLGSVIYIVANFVIGYSVYRGTSEFVPNVRKKLAAYFTDKHLNMIKELGGWNEFCSAVRVDGEGNRKVNIQPHVNNFTTNYLDEVFNEPPSSETSSVGANAFIL